MYANEENQENVSFEKPLASEDAWGSIWIFSPEYLSFSFSHSLKRNNFFSKLFKTLQKVRVKKKSAISQEKIPFFQNPEKFTKFPKMLQILRILQMLSILQKWKCF